MTGSGATGPVTATTGATAGRGPSSRRRPLAPWWALLADVLVVVTFTFGGADAHERGAGDLVRIGWPFLAALAITWLVARVWRAPAALWPSGVLVWFGTLAIGMGLRAVTGGGTAWTFVLVAAALFAAGFLGWRLVVALVRVGLRR
ncbi:MAG: DUF3054 domain-containing protein [Actinomycetaceae bacterium]